MTAMAVCPNGHPVPDENRFCNQCGATMVLPPVLLAPAAETAEVRAGSDETWQAPPRVAPSVSSPPNSSALPQGLMTEIPPKKRSDTPLYVLAGLVILFAIGGVVLVLVTGKDTSTTQPSGTPTSVVAPTTPLTPGAPTQTTSRGPLPSEASPCSGTLTGGRPFGHMGDPAASSCAFISSTFRAYIADPSGGPYTVHSDAANRDYNNVTCTPRAGWVFCQGGRPDVSGTPSARMYFAQ